MPRGLVRLTEPPCLNPDIALINIVFLFGCSWRRVVRSPMTKGIEEAGRVKYFTARSNPLQKTKESATICEVRQGQGDEEECL